MKIHVRTLAAIGAAAIVATSLAACSGGSSGNQGPIVVGAVNSITGPVSFSDVAGAAQAVFDKVNADGGINGRKIEFKSQDDSGDPALSSQAGRRLVDQDNVVALTGSASMVDCSANAALYAQRGVVSITGTGVDPACFKSANIAPVNTGPFAAYQAMLTYASEDLKKQRVCAIILGLPGITEGYENSVAQWTKATGKKPVLVDTSVTFGNDPTPAILAAKSANCDAVVFNSIEQTVASFMATVHQQGMEDLAWLTIGSSYTDAALAALQKQGTLGLYVNSEFLPYTTNDSALADWRKTLTDAKVPLTSLSIGGYLSAEYLVEVLKGIKGDITRESVTAAFKDLQPIKNPIVGMPFTFGTATAHAPNLTSKVVQVTADGWKVSSDWIKP